LPVSSRGSSSVSGANNDKLGHDLAHPFRRHLPAGCRRDLIYLSRGDDEAARRNARWIALWTTIVTFAVSVILVLRFDPAQPGFQFVEKTAWLANGIGYHMGVDGISLPFVILTTALMPFCILASWKSVTLRVREYMMAFLFWKR
jgi:NADH-quinone oxidoreductase subunit M